MKDEQLEAILVELKKTNEMLSRFLTNGNQTTEDAMHSDIADVSSKVDSIRNDVNAIKQQLNAKNA